MEVFLSKGLKEEVNYAKSMIKESSNSGSKLILLMPERYHYEGLKLILNESQKESISNIEVLSFNRFYHRIFEEADCFKKELSIDDKELILKDIISDYVLVNKDCNLGFNEDDDLKLSAYTIEVLKLIKLIDEEEFNIEDIKDNNILNIVNKYYDSFLNSGVYTFYPSLICAAENELLHNTKSLLDYISNTHIISFMSYEYTNAQIRLFNLLENTNCNISIDVLFPYGDNNINDYKSFEEYDSYYYVLKNINKINDIYSSNKNKGKNNNTNVNVSLLDSKYDSKGINKTNAFSNSINTIFEEVYELAYNIKKNFKNEIRSSSIRVLVNGLDDYKEQIDNVFKALKIPYHYDREYNLTNSKLISAYERMLLMISKDFDTKEIFKLLKCGLAIIKKKSNKNDNDETINPKKFNSAVKKLERELINNKKATKFNSWMNGDNFTSDLFNHEVINNDDSDIVKNIKERNNENIDINNVIRLHIKDIYDIYNSDNTNSRYIKLLSKLFDIFYVENNEIIYQEKLEGLVKDNLIDDCNAKDNYKILSSLVIDTTSQNTKKFHDEILIEEFNNNTILEADNIYVLGLSDKDFKVKRRQNLIDEEDMLNEFYSYKYSINNIFIENTLKLNDGFIVASFINTIGKEQDKLLVNEHFSDVYGDTKDCLTTLKEKIELLDKDNEEEIILLIQKENLLQDFDKHDDVINIFTNILNNNNGMKDRIKNIFFHKKNTNILTNYKIEIPESDEVLTTEVPFDLLVPALHLDMKDKDKPIKTSYSKIDDFVGCEYRYALQNIAKIKKLDIDAIANTTFGSLLHKIFEIVFKNYDKNQKDFIFDKDNNKLTSDIIYKALYDEVYGAKKTSNDKYEERWEFLFTDKHYEGYLKGVIEFAISNLNFVIDEINATNFKDIHNEVKIDMTSDNFSMEGYIDRLDSVTTEEGKTIYRIFDYKSSEIPEVDFELFSHMQLYIYAMILQKKYKEEKDKLTKDDIVLNDIENISSLGYIHLVGKTIEATKSRYSFDGTNWSADKFIKDYKFATQFIYDTFNMDEFKKAFDNVEYDDEGNMKNPNDLLNLPIQKPDKTNIDLSYGNLDNWKNYHQTDISNVNNNVFKVDEFTTETEEGVKSYKIFTKDDSFFNPYTKDGKVDEGYIYKTIDNIAKKMKSGDYKALPGRLGTKGEGNKTKPCVFCEYKNLCEFYVNNEMANNPGSVTKAVYHDLKKKDIDANFNEAVKNTYEYLDYADIGNIAKEAQDAKKAQEEKEAKEKQKAEEKAKKEQEKALEKEKAKKEKEEAKAKAKAEKEAEKAKAKK